MSKKKQYKTVNEMLIDLDPEFAREVRAQVEACKQVTALMKMRCMAGLSQAEFAEHANLAEIEVEWWESGIDNDLTPEIIQTYKRVCNG